MHCITDLHKHIIGIPRYKLLPDIEGCDTFGGTQAAQHRSRYTQHKEGRYTCRSRHFGFIVQRSKDLSGYEDFLGLNGESAYLLLGDYKMNMLFGIATVIKTPPLAWMNRWLSQ
jgi:hypothetical protein